MFGVCLCRVSREGSLSDLSLVLVFESRVESYNGLFLSFPFLHMGKFLAADNEPWASHLGPLHTCFEDSATQWASFFWPSLQLFEDFAVVLVLFLLDAVTNDIATWEVLRNRGVKTQWTSVVWYPKNVSK